MSIVTCTLDLTSKFIDLKKIFAEKMNSQTNEKSHWCHIFKNGGSSNFGLNIRSIRCE
jgi:hypothetical protein